MIEFRQVRIGYDKPLIEIDQLELQEGRFYTLVGKNGVGKTTLLNTLLGLIPLHSGEIYLNGTNQMSNWKSHEMAKLVAHVPSRFEGVQHLTGRDYIAMGRAPYTNFLGKLSPDDWSIVDQVIMSLGIAHFADMDTSRLSDGERQIASIAKALVQQTQVILLDEPTAFLDYANRMKVLRLLKQIAGETNICVLQSSHDLELCLEFSDELLVIDPEAKKLICMNNEGLLKQEVINIAFPEIS